MIIVKGMQLPRSCAECPLNAGEYSPECWEKRYCSVTGSDMTKKSNERRLRNCPLVEVKGVMDYAVAPKQIGDYWRCGKCNNYLMNGFEAKYPMPRMVRKFCSVCGYEVDWDKVRKLEENK